MRKIFQTLAFSTLLLGTAQAGDGFYLGGGIGMHASDSEINIVDTNVIHDTGVRDRSVLGQIAMGYDRIFLKGLLLGAEIDGRYGPMDTKNFTVENNNLKGKTKVQGAFGIAARVGLKHEKLKVYARLGYDWSRLKFDYTNAGQALNNIKQSKRISGFTPGLGLSHDVTEHWTLGLEGRTTFYGKKKFFGQRPNSNNNSKIRIKAREDTFLFNVRYYFN